MHKRGIIPKWHKRMHISQNWHERQAFVSHACIAASVAGGAICKESVVHWRTLIVLCWTRNPSWSPKLEKKMTSFIHSWVRRRKLSGQKSYKMSFKPILYWGRDRHELDLWDLTRLNPNFTWSMSSMLLFAIRETHWVQRGMMLREVTWWWFRYSFNHWNASSWNWAEAHEKVILTLTDRRTVD